MKRFIQFCLVGASGVLVDMSVLFLLANPAILAWPAPLAKALAVEAAILNNFRSIRCSNSIGRACWNFGLQTYWGLT